MYLGVLTVQSAPDTLDLRCRTGMWTSEPISCGTQERPPHTMSARPQDRPNKGEFRAHAYRDGVAQLKRDAFRLTSNGHGGDVSSVGSWFTHRVRANLGSAGLPEVTSLGPESLRDFVW